MIDMHLHCDTQKSLLLHDSAKPHKSSLVNGDIVNSINKKEMKNFELFYCFRTLLFDPVHAAHMWERRLESKVLNIQKHLIVVICNTFFEGPDPGNRFEDRLFFGKHVIQFLCWLKVLR